MATVNTYVTALDESTGEMVTLKPGDTVPDSVHVTNPHVLGELQEEWRSDSPLVVPGPSQTVPFDPDSEEASTRAAGDRESDGLDKKSHAELDAYAEEHGIDMTGLGDKPSRQDKIAHIRSVQNMGGDTELS